LQIAIQNIFNTFVDFFSKSDITKSNFISSYLIFSLLGILYENPKYVREQLNNDLISNFEFFFFLETIKGLLNLSICSSSFQLARLFCDTTFCSTYFCNDFVLDRSFFVFVFSGLWVLIVVAKLRYPVSWSVLHTSLVTPCVFDTLPGFREGKGGGRRKIWCH